MIELTKQQVLAKVPQAFPFRFIDEILQIHDEGIKATYQFKSDEFFYKGHFPNNPITPGVILLETAAQASVVAYGIYLSTKYVPEINVDNFTTLFTEVEAEFFGMVKPEDKVIVEAKKVYFRRLKLKVTFIMSLANTDTIICSGSLSGMGVQTQ